MKFLALILGWILLSVGVAAIFSAYRISHKQNATYTEMAALSMGGTVIAAGGGALLLWVAA